MLALLQRTEPGKDTYLGWVFSRNRRIGRHPGLLQRAGVPGGDPTSRPLPAAWGAKKWIAVAGRRTARGLIQRSRTGGTSCPGAGLRSAVTRL